MTAACAFRIKMSRCGKSESALLLLGTHPEEHALPDRSDALFLSRLLIQSLIHLANTELKACPKEAWV